MKSVRVGIRLSPVLLGVLIAACDTNAPVVANPDDRVGIVVTGWGTVKGNSPEYNAGLYQRAFLGSRANSPDEPCTDWYLGEFPYRSELGQIPFAVVYKVPGFEKIWDGYGVYRLSDDGQSYVSILDSDLVLTGILFLSRSQGRRGSPGRLLPDRVAQRLTRCI